MTVEHQMPLFADYPITVQFDRRRGQIAPYLRRKRRQCPASELVDEIYAPLEIYPIRLVLSHRSFSEVPEGNKEGERDCYCYTSTIPFLGDRELWFLSPLLEPEPPIEPQFFEVEGCLLEGEIFRQELIISVLAEHRSLGTRFLDDRLAEIQRVIELQNGLICQFHAQLREEIARQIEQPSLAGAAARHH